MENLKGILNQRKELIEEAFYFISALENEDYNSEEDKVKLEEELEQIIRELNIEFEDD
jgi:hypothetical protein|tara:strand:- start:5056 stop:5229 length:174 start_codon:yes stop_codon:yes gene_type:complete